MKKIIALVLSLLMVFSMGSIAFVSMAEDADPVPEETTEATEEEKTGLSLDDLMNLPLGEAMAGLKAAKFVLKLAKFILKVGKFLMKLGIIDEDTIVNLVTGLIGNDGTEETTTPEAAPAEETTEVDAKLPA